jgi:hypothetical protein
MNATLFPYKLNKVENTDHQWQYINETERMITSQDYVIKGPFEDAAMWHNSILYRTCTVIEQSKNFSLSLRYWVGKSNSNKSMTWIDDMNEAIERELRPIRTRFEPNEQGQAKSSYHQLGRAVI